MRGANDYVEAIRARTRIGMPPCTHPHPAGVDGCTTCLVRWGDDRTMDVALLLQVIDELLCEGVTPAP